MGNLVLALLVAMAAGAQATPAPIPIATTIEVGGQAMHIAGELTLAPAQAPDGGTRVNARIDLGVAAAALHAAILERLPGDRCRRHAVDNWVAKLRRYHVSADAGRLLIEVGLDVEVWACLEWHGSEVRRKVADGRVYARLPLALEIADAGLRLQVGRPQVDAYGPLGDAARVYFAARGAEIGDLLAAKVAALNARQATFPVPALWLHQGKLRSARFVDAGRPSLEIVAELQPVLPGWASRLLGRKP